MMNTEDLDTDLLMSSEGRKGKMKYNIILIKYNDSIYVLPTEQKPIRFKIKENDYDIKEENYNENISSN